MSEKLGLRAMSAVGYYSSNMWREAQDWLKDTKNDSILCNALSNGPTIRTFLLEKQNCTTLEDALNWLNNVGIILSTLMKEDLNVTMEEYTLLEDLIFYIGEVVQALEGGVEVVRELDPMEEELDITNEHQLMGALFRCMF